MGWCACTDRRIAKIGPVNSLPGPPLQRAWLSGKVWFGYGRLIFQIFCVKGRSNGALTVVASFMEGGCGHGRIGLDRVVTTSLLTLTTPVS